MSFKYSVLIYLVEFWKKQFLSECDVHLMVPELAITGRRLSKLIRARELAASHKLEKIRRVRMLGKKPVWKRKGGFDRIEIIAEIHEQTLRRLHEGFDSEPLYIGLYNPRRPPTPEEFTLNMNV